VTQHWNAGQVFRRERPENATFIYASSLIVKKSFILPAGSIAPEFTDELFFYAISARLAQPRKCKFPAIVGARLLSLNFREIRNL